ncbi:MAG: PadR family transcriptional regulator [Anaerolineae bacterium]|jgi:DNA-binding PadR family transcriptional regulator|nr:PadR family transcriptional regulator [Anaerolineae bacterium]
MNDIQNIQKHIDKLSAELRRGLIVLVVMSQLKEAEYGYSLLKKLETKGYSITQDTLYPLLRRLEKQGYVSSDWKVDEPRPRRYYQLNGLGEAVFTALREEWQDQFVQINQIISEE